MEKCRKTLKDNPERCQPLKSGPCDCSSGQMAGDAASEECRHKGDLDTFSKWLTFEMRGAAYRRWRSKLDRHHYSMVVQALCLAGDAESGCCDKYCYRGATFWNADTDRSVQIQLINTHNFDTRLQKTFLNN